MTTLQMTDVTEMTDASFKNWIDYQSYKGQIPTMFGEPLVDESTVMAYGIKGGCEIMIESLSQPYISMEEYDEYIEYIEYNDEQREYEETINTAIKKLKAFIKTI